jgi:hypothetical protein
MEGPEGETMERGEVGKGEGGRIREERGEREGGRGGKGREWEREKERETWTWEGGGCEWRE